MGNCCSKPTVSESINSHHHVSTPSSPPPVETSIPSSPPVELSVAASGDPVGPSPPMDPSLSASGGDPVRPSLPMDPSLPISADPVPSSPPLDAIESIGELYKKVDPEMIDPLIDFIETQLRKMNTPSEAGSSSSEGWLATGTDVTKLAAKTIDAISREAEKLSESEVVKAMGSLALKIMKGAGQLHWVFVGLSVAAYAIESYLNAGHVRDECKELLLKILQLAKDVKKFSVLMPEEKEKVCNVVRTIVQGAIICCNCLKSGNFFRSLLGTKEADQLEEIKKQLRDASTSLDLSVDLKTLQTLNEFPRRTKQSPLHLLEFQPVGIEDQVKEVKAMLDMEGPQPALAVIVCGFGGAGKSTLADYVVQSLVDWSCTEFKFCKVAIDEKDSKTSHIIQLQRDIIYNLDQVELILPTTHDGQLEIKKALENKCFLLLIDNVVDKQYIEDLLPKDLRLQKTKLRILITSREEDVKVKLIKRNINCKVHIVRTLPEAASQRLLLKAIVQDEIVEDKDFDEKCMINKVAHACKGVPLLLSVFGEYLRSERDKHSYQEVLDVLQQGNLDIYRDEDLGKRLMHVYHKIKDSEVQEAFLDICTYFHGSEWNLVADIVDFSKLEELRRKMLVSKSGSGEVIVHDILRLVGMEIAKDTRISNSDNLDGFENVEGMKGVSLIKDNRLITIQSTQLEAMSQSLRVLMLGDWVTLEGPPCQKAFSNLRYLSVGDITAFPFKDPFKLDELRVLLNRSKQGMSLSYLPSSLKRLSHQVPVVECDKFVKLPFQNLSCLKSFIVQTQKSLELPEEFHLPASLVALDLSTCKNLPKYIGHLTALESVILDRCDLERLPQGFGKLRKLKHLSMDYCFKLAFLGEELGMLFSLEALSINSCRNLRTLPESLGGLLCCSIYIGTPYWYQS